MACISLGKHAIVGHNSTSISLNKMSEIDLIQILIVVDWSAMDDSGRRCIISKFFGMKYDVINDNMSNSRILHHGIGNLPVSRSENTVYDCF